MIHQIKPSGCRCGQTTPARIGFTNDAFSTPDTAPVATDWHWLLIAALAALVLFQAFDRPGQRKTRR